MNLKLRTELLSRVWLMAATDGLTGATPQKLYGVSETSKIQPIYQEVLDKFLTKTLPWVNKVTDAESTQITYEFPATDEIIQHLIYRVLIANRSTFVRFFIATYCQSDPDSVLSAGELWAMMLSWARKYDLPPQYLPVAQTTLADELENLGYTRCRGSSGAAFWGIKIG